MLNPRLAARYAKSLIDLSVERNCLEDSLKDMRVLHQFCTQSYDFVVMLRSPVISSDKKLKVITLLLEGWNISEMTHLFIKLLVTKGRESALPEIATAFEAQYNELKNIRTVRITTALPVSAEFAGHLEEKIAAFLPGSTLALETVVDESIIGGFVIESQDKLFDASVRKSLNDFKSRIIDTSYESKIG